LASGDWEDKAIKYVNKFYLSNEAYIVLKTLIVDPTTFTTEN